MKYAFFRFLARLNKWLLPSFTRKGVDLSKASKWQLALLGWKYYVTSKVLEHPADQVKRIRESTW